MIKVLCCFALFITVISGESGKCSYSTGGGITASGEKLDDNAFTAAHKTLPFNTKVKVTALGKSVVVRINDREAFTDPERILVVSKGAAEELGLINAGVAACTVTEV